MSPSTASSGRFGKLPLISIGILSILFLLACNVLLGQLMHNGYADFVLDLVKNTGRGRISSPEQLLPGPKYRPVLLRYTGNAWIDKVFAAGNVLFANVGDGSRPELSLLAFHFAGQVVPLFAMIVITGLREKSAFAVRWSIVWGLAGQALSFGVATPLFFIIHLLSSSEYGSTMAAISLRDYMQAQSIIPAIVVGYILPTIFAMYPHEDVYIPQWCIAIWQLFPLYVIVAMWLFAETAKRNSLGGNLAKPQQELDKGALQSVYSFCMGVAALTQFVTISIMGLAAFNPAQFPDEVADALTPARVFGAGPPYSSEPFTSPSEVIHQFFVYDQLFAVVSALVWTMTLCAQAGESMKYDIYTIADVLRRSLIFGPGGAAMSFLQDRDEAVFEANGESS